LPFIRSPGRTLPEFWEFTAEDNPSRPGGVGQPVVVSAAFSGGSYLALIN
jgi:hypothetical protein